MKYTVSLKEPHLFRRLYAKGKSAAAGKSRLGLTVGTKVGKAVVRNKIRRRIREAYRIHEHQMTPGFDIVVVGRVRAAFASYAELERDLLRLLDKLGVRQREGRK